MSVKMERMDTGIPGLNDILEGGLPFPSTVLISGPTGCGKTTFALQFMSQGARDGEGGIFFTTLSEPIQWMLRFAQDLDFFSSEDFGKRILYRDLGFLLLEDHDEDAMIRKLIETVEDDVGRNLPRRVVFDPITVLQQQLGTSYRRFLFQLSARMKNWQTITIMTGESCPGEDYQMDVAHTMDGVILLYNEPDGDMRSRSIEVLKMRGTSHRCGRHALDLSSGGLSVQVGLR